MDIEKSQPWILAEHMNASASGRPAQAATLKNFAGSTQPHDLEPGAVDPPARSLQSNGFGLSAGHMQSGPSTSFSNAASVNDQRNGTSVDTALTEPRQPKILSGNANYTAGVITKEQGT